MTKFVVMPSSPLLPRPAWAQVSFQHPVVKSPQPVLLRHGERPRVTERILFPYTFNFIFWITNCKTEYAKTMIGNIIRLHSNILRRLFLISILVKPEFRPYYKICFSLYLCLYNQLFALFHYVFKFLTHQNFKNNHFG